MIEGCVPRPRRPRPANPNSHRGAAPMSLALIAFTNLFALEDGPFESYLDGLRLDLAPSTFLEILLVEQMITAVGRLRNAAKMEKAGAIEPKWLRYQSMAERGYWKAWNALEKGRRDAARAAKTAPRANELPT